jgi:hypothetical protein
MCVLQAVRGAVDRVMLVLRDMAPKGRHKKPKRKSNKEQNQKKEKEKRSK